MMKLYLIYKQVYNLNTFSIEQDFIGIVFRSKEKAIEYINNQQYGGYTFVEIETKD